MQCTVEDSAVGSVASLLDGWRQHIQALPAAGYGPMPNAKLSIVRHGPGGLLVVEIDGTVHPDIPVTIPTLVVSEKVHDAQPELEPHTLRCVTINLQETAAALSLSILTKTGLCYPAAFLVQAIVECITRVGRLTGAPVEHIADDEPRCTDTGEGIPAILPCPFCGIVPDDDDDSEVGHTIACYAKDCPVRVSTDRSKTLLRGFHGMFVTIALVSPTRGDSYPYVDTNGRVWSPHGLEPIPEGATDPMQEPEIASTPKFKPGDLITDALSGRPREDTNWMVRQIVRSYYDGERFMYSTSRGEFAEEDIRLVPAHSTAYAIGEQAEYVGAGSEKNPGISTVTSYIIEADPTKRWPMYHLANGASGSTAFLIPVVNGVAVLAKRTEPV